METIVADLLVKMVDIVVLQQSDSEPPTEPPTEPPAPAPQLDEPSNKPTHQHTQHEPQLEDHPLMDLDIDVDLLGTYSLYPITSNYPH